MDFLYIFSLNFQIISALLATAYALPLEDTASVKAAKDDFMASFRMAEAGRHAELAPKMEYLEDDDSVKAAKAEFMKAFEAAEAGEHAALAPKPAEIAPIKYNEITPVVYANPWNTYGYNYPGFYAGQYGYAAPWAWNGYNGYAGAYYL